MGILKVLALKELEDSQQSLLIPFTQGQEELLELVRPYDDQKIIPSV